MENIDIISEKGRRTGFIPFLLTAALTLFFTLIGYYAGVHYGINVATESALEILEYRAADPKTTDPSLIRSSPAAVYGIEDADSVIRVFIDLECSSCASFIEETISSLAQNSEYRVEFYDLPSENHRYSRSAAAYARCAASQGVDYLTYVRQLSSDFSAWTSMLKETNVSEYLLQAAVKYGADADQMNLCVIGEDVYEMIDSNVESASAVGAEGTPSFIIGSTVMNGYVSEKTFRSMMNKFGK